MSALKIGAPHNPELAIGSVTEDGTAIYDGLFINKLGLDENYVKQEKEKQVEEIKRRRKEYGATQIPIEGRMVILIDDGMATGSTMLAAVRSLKQRGAKSVILAVPVSPPDAVEIMKKEVDEVVCLHCTAAFGAVGYFYRDFDQTSDEEVKQILKEFNKHEAQG